MPTPSLLSGAALATFSANQKQWSSGPGILLCGWAGATLSCIQMLELHLTVRSAGEGNQAENVGGRHWGTRWQGELAPWGEQAAGGRSGWGAEGKGAAWIPQLLDPPAICPPITAFPAVVRVGGGVNLINIFDN